MDAKQFLKDAHRHGHRGPFMLARWALKINSDRRHPSEYVSTDTLNEAIRIDRAADDGQLFPTED